MARKVQLYRRWGKIDNVATACGVGRHRSSDCYTYEVKPLQGNLRIKRGIVSLRRIGKGQQVFFWEDTAGKVYDIIPKFE